jgi:hypothetical protein
MKPAKTQLVESLVELVRSRTEMVPPERFYLRPTGLFDPARDQVPAVLILDTPGVPEGLTRRLQRTDLVYPVTAILIDGANKTKSTKDAAALSDPDWRTAWKESLRLLLHGHSLSVAGETEIVWNRVEVDGSAALDLTQFDASNLWHSEISLRLICRVKKTGE